ncbi:hypothetical protein GUITHDRAFT_122441 [Guillardia theta CCMP2712]|uniref:Uncharacterized protein n=1 Tax=Guillardia theta (strain CCMP2712) TaxID=905079 RepID=L1I5L5_GUITC|nr:hypothetical protein GUITHDRAFT_122441 [Guillardia theta CCMP2712]EKX31362.1 hypothetical protein GUITHDRAFT_122441 [Guillardia theta CCMP2712]|eukprot:XP_005818342.1 hypothetical protein GUITHDRAFT_122441 [Guillardia theta CCMP2712]
MDCPAGEELLVVLVLSDSTSSNMRTVLELHKRLQTRLCDLKDHSCRLEDVTTRMPERQDNKSATHHLLLPASAPSLAPAPSPSPAPASAPSPSPVASAPAPAPASAPPSPSPLASAPNRSGVGVRPHPDEVLCSVFLNALPKQIHALEPLVLSVSFHGLQEGCRYKVQVQIVLKDLLRIVFHENRIVRLGDEQPLEYHIASFYPGNFLIRATLFDDFAREEADESIVAMTTKMIASVAPCQVSYLWSSSGRQLFQGSISYSNSPFARAMRADSSPPHPLTVTMATISTVDRATVLMNTAAHWKEDMAVAFYARSPEDERDLRRYVADSLGPWFSSRNKSLEAVMLSVCPNREDPLKILVFPINMLRKIACSIAKTDLILYTDVDMIASDDIASHIRQVYEGTRLKPKDLLVVPSFKGSSSWPPVAEIQRGNNTTQVQVTTHPVTVADVIEHFIHCRVHIPGMRCGMWTLASRWSEDGVFHAPTSYDRWMEEKEVYEVSYVVGYEPYFVVNRSAWEGRHGAGIYDDRFVHWGWDKASIGFEAARLGYSFVVLPGAFFVHVSYWLEDPSISLRLFSISPRPEYTDWGPPDTHGRRLLQDEVLRQDAAGKGKATIGSCLVPAFKIPCDLSKLRLLPRPRLLSLAGFRIIELELEGLVPGVGYQISVHAPSPEEQPYKAGHMWHFAILPLEREETVAMNLSLPSDLRQGRWIIRLDLQDLQAAKLMEAQGTLIWDERVYEL